MPPPEKARQTNNESELEKLKIYVFSKGAKDDVKYFNGYVVFDKKPLSRITIKHQLKEKLVKGQDVGKDFVIKANALAFETMEEIDNETVYNKLGYGKCFDNGETTKFVSQALDFNLFGDTILNIPVTGWVNEVPKEGKDALNCCLSIDTYAIEEKDSNYEGDNFKYSAGKWRFEPQEGWGWDTIAEVAESLNEDGNFNEFEEFMTNCFPSSSTTKAVKIGSKTQSVLDRVKKIKPNTKAMTEAITEQEIPF